MFNSLIKTWYAVPLECSSLLPVQCRAGSSWRSAQSGQVLAIDEGKPLALTSVKAITQIYTQRRVATGAALIIWHLRLGDSMLQIEPCLPAIQLPEQSGVQSQW